MNSSAVRGATAFLWTCTIAMLLSFVCNEAQANIFTEEDTLAINQLRSDAVHMATDLPYTTGGGFYTFDDLRCSLQLSQSLRTVASSLEEAMVLVKISSEMGAQHDESVVIDQGVLRALLQSMEDIGIHLEPITRDAIACSKAQVIASKAASISEFVDRSLPILRGIYGKIPGHELYQVPKDLLPRD